MVSRIGPRSAHLAPSVALCLACILAALAIRPEHGASSPPSGPQPLSASVPGFLNAVAAVSPSDVWAVGVTAATLPYIQRTLIVHWAGGGWQVVPTVPATSSMTLRGIAALSAHDVWAVGGDGGNGGFMHWDGRRWQESPGAVLSPDFSVSGILQGVAASAADDVWAAGTLSNRGALSPLMEHW